MKVMIGGNIATDRALRLAQQIRRMGHEPIMAGDVPTQETDMLCIIDEVLPAPEPPPKLEMVMQHFEDPDPTEKPNYDEIKRECRENSIVRNPCLPRRWKKGKIG